MDGYYFRVQRKSLNVESFYNANPWQFIRCLDTLSGCQGYLVAARRLWPQRQYRIVEWIVDEIYDVVPEEPANG